MPIAPEIGHPIIELDLHPDRPKRLDEMRLIRKHQARMMGIENHFRNRVEDAIPDTAIEHSDDAPHASLGAVLAA